MKNYMPRDLDSRIMGDPAKPDNLAKCPDDDTVLIFKKGCWSIDKVLVECPECGDMFKLDIIENTLEKV